MLISIYLIVAIVCAVVLIAMAIFGNIFGDVDVDTDIDLDLDLGDVGIDIGEVDLDAGATGLSPISLPVALVFGTMFGSFGAILEAFEVNAYLVPVIATVISLVITGALYILFVKFFIETQATSTINKANLVGRSAETTMPITKENPGQIMVLTEERGRTLLEAISNDNIPTNTMVKITGLAGNGVKVELPKEVK